MTFIVAIQLNDSIIVATDNQQITQKEDGDLYADEHKVCKMHFWDNGIITGTGESYVISRAVTLFKELADLDIYQLPDCLDLSRQIREIEIGKHHFQVKNSKLLCSSYSENGAQLYKIQRFDSAEPYNIEAMKPFNIDVWLFYPDSLNITSELKSLYDNLRDYAFFFKNKTAWVNHYISQLFPIFKKQSTIDPCTSASFDILFQTKNEYIFGHVPNTEKASLKLKEIQSI